MMKRIHFFIFLVFSIPLWPLDYCLSDPQSPRSDQIRKIEENLSREKDKYLKFDIKEKNLLGQLSEIEKRIAEKRELLKKLEDKVSIQKKEVQESIKKLKKLEINANNIRKKISKKIIIYYKYAKIGYIKLLATASDLDELRKRMYYLRIVMGEDRALLNGILDVLREHEEQVQRVEKKLSAVKRLEMQESDELSLLKQELNKKVLLLMKIHKEKEFYETAVKELKTAAAKLKDTLNGLEEKPGKQVKLRSSFAEYKGKLKLPYDGKIIRDYHPLREGPAMTHRGIFVQGKEQGEVRAVYDGRVDYSGWLKGYGRIIIINHGSRYFSISAHLSELRCDKGDLVREGEVIALAGDSGSLSGPGLYFELRKGGEPLDPLDWVKGR